MSLWKDKSRDVIVVILGGGRGARLDPLTRWRAKPAVPMAGKYRLIDIPISNAIHSGMERIFVLTQYNSVSLHRHIQRTYKFDIFSRGFVEILAAQQSPTDERWYQGTADAVRQNLRLISGSRGDLVLILSGDHLYRMDYAQMLRDHLEADAEVTLGVLPCSEKEVSGFGAVRVAAGRSTGGGYCAYTDKGGETAIVHWTIENADGFGTWSIAGGTGMWATAQGGGTWTTVSLEADGSGKTHVIGVLDLK